MFGQHSYKFHLEMTIEIEIEIEIEKMKEKDICKIFETRNKGQRREKEKECSK